MPEEPHKTELKPTKAEVRRRIDITESLLIDCATVTDTVRYFKEKEGLLLARRTVERYRTLAERRIVKAAGSVREQEVRKAKLRFERCFARAISGNKKNLPAAIAAQKGLNALLGLEAPKDSEEPFNMEEFAREVVRQRQEMHRATVGLDREIIELFERYKASGENCAALIQAIARIAESNNGGTTSESEKSV